jgi:hypothetical protein
MINKLKVLLSDNRFDIINDNEKVINLFKTDYSTSFKLFKDDSLFFRGADNNNDIIIQNPIQRKSLVNKNFYNLLMSYLPSYSKFPKRDHAIIMATNSRLTEYFSDTCFFVFPKNGANMGILPANDIWNTFDHTIGDIQKFDNFINIIMKITNNKFANKDYEHLQDMLLNFPNDIKNGDIPSYKLNELKNYAYDDNKMTELYDNIPQLFKYISDNMNPEKNNIKQYTLENMIYPEVEGGSEIWTDSPCLMIKLSYFYNHIFEKI